MWRNLAGLAAALLPFVIAALWEWRQSRQAFRNLPEPTETAKRHGSGPL